MNNNGDTTGGSLWPTASFGGTGSGSYAGDRHSTANKSMVARATSADGDIACDTAIAETPSEDGFVEVLINGVQVEVGDGVKTKSCYFSADGGATARPIADIAAGDRLYWNGSIATFQLSTTDTIEFDYEVDVA